MAPRKSDGPVGRGDAPAGPEKLSAVDGASITATPNDQQACAVVSSQGAASLVVIVTPVPTRPGFFTAQLAGDDQLLPRSRAPFFDAARTLLAAGFDPATRLTMMHAGSAIMSLSATIAAAARFTVEESAHGPVLRNFRTAPSSAVEAPRMRFQKRTAVR